MIKESCGVLKIWHKENRQCKTFQRELIEKCLVRVFSLWIVNLKEVLFWFFWERSFSFLLFIYKNVHVCVVYTSLCIIFAASLGLGLVSVWCNVWSHPLSQFLYWSLINTVRIIPYNQIILASLSTRVSI